jgi:hypothetical protein
MRLSTNYAGMPMQAENSGKIVATIFYPDAARGARLVEAFHRSLKNLGGGDALDPRPWRLDILEWPEMQAQATQDIAGSDVIVVPADDTYASSVFFRRWVETWPTALEARQLLLVHINGVGDPWSSSVQRQFVNWLQELAERKGMELALVGADDAFIQSWSDLNEQVTSPAGRLAPSHPKRQATDDYLAEWETPPAPRFLGLNE